MCADDYSHLLQLFDHRLESYENWTGDVSPIDLALAGFHYMGKEDVVRCFKCDIEVYKWKSDDVPILDHLKFSPNCSYARMMKSCLPAKNRINTFFVISVIPLIFSIIYYAVLKYIYALHTNK